MLSKVELYKFFVEPFHVDFTGHLFLGVLGNHLLNAAGHHSHNRGWGIDQLNESHLTWVLSRLCIELTEMPSQYENVEVETWVESVMKLFTERNFLIRNADDGRIYGYARSVWAMIDTATRHPADLLKLNAYAVKAVVGVAVIILNYIFGKTIFRKRGEKKDGGAPDEGDAAGGKSDDES